MKKNLHVIDRFVRFVFAITVVLLWVAGVLTGVYAAVFLAVAVILGLTALLNFCPIYYFLGISGKKGQK